MTAKQQDETQERWEVVVDSTYEPAIAVIRSGARVVAETTLIRDADRIVALHNASLSPGEWHAPGNVYVCNCADGEHKIAHYHSAKAIARILNALEAKLKAAESYGRACDYVMGDQSAQIAALTTRVKEVAP